MSALREKVSIKTPTSDLTGKLVVGTDGLPELRVEERVAPTIPYTRLSVYRPSTFPAAWTLQQAELGDVGILFESWRTISEMQFAIATAEREVEHG